MRIKIILLALLICFFIKTVKAQTSCNVIDSLALVDFYHSTNGQNWNHSEGWLQGYVYTWNGIYLDNTGRVAYIILNNNNITGSISTTIGNLTNLQVLNLGDNKLSGSIPSTISNLTNLQDTNFGVGLDLDDNQLSGSIPVGIGNLTKIGTIDLSENQLSGTIPTTLGNLPNLSSLYLGFNKLSGTIPATLGSLPNLVSLDLSYNQLSGGYPSTLGNLPNVAMNVSNNYLTFAGLELLFNKYNNLINCQFFPQATIKIINNNGLLSVNVGGTIKNNIYHWYNDTQYSGQLIATITGDSTYTPNMAGTYSVVVSNSIVDEGTSYVLSDNGPYLYSDTVTVAPTISNNANLSALKLNIGTLTPVFATTTTSYTASVANTVTSITITPTTADATAIIKVNGTAVISGKASAAIALNVGTNIISTVVTAQDGVTTKTYTVTVTRSLSNNAYLSFLKLTGSGTVLSPAFTFTNTTYTANAPYTTTSVTVLPTTYVNTSSMKVNGVTLASGTTSRPIFLNVGANTINITVTAQDGKTKETYTITVTRTLSTNAYLSYMKIGGGGATLSPAFTFTNTTYSASVPNTTTSVTVTPTTYVTTSTQKVNGTALASGTTSPAIPLSVGSNTINIEVTAQDGVTTLTYTITVTRAAAADNSLYQAESVENPLTQPQLAEDGIVVHQAVSPNGDGINDFLTIENIGNYPENRLLIMNRSGQLVYDAKGYDNSNKVFDGHSNKTGAMQLPGTYFYSLDYSVKGIIKHKTGFLVLKY